MKSIEFADLLYSILVSNHIKPRKNSIFSILSVSFSFFFNYFAKIRELSQISKNTFFGYKRIISVSYASSTPAGRRREVEA